jgi:YVTN family beta-propeller protein
MLSLVPVLVVVLLMSLPSSALTGSSSHPAGGPAASAIPAVAARPSPGTAGPSTPHPQGAPNGVAVDGSMGTVGTGLFPYGADYDPANQMLYVANYGNDNVTVLNATSGHHVADISMDSNPTGVAYVGWNQCIYVIVEGTDSIAVINGTTNFIVATIKLAGEPENLAYDTANRELYATVWASTSSPIGLQPVLTSNNTALPPIRAGFSQAYELTADPVNNTIWVENNGNDSITVVSGATNTVVRWVHPGPQPHGAALQAGMAYSPVGDQMFVVNDANPGTMNVIGASNYTLLASGIPVGAMAFGATATYDPASECVYVASYEVNTVTVVSVLNDTQAEPTISLKGGPWVGTYDPTTGVMFFLLSSTNGAARIFPGIALQFDQTGLPAGTLWTVVANGASQSTRQNTMTFVEPVGTTSYSVGSIPGYVVPTPVAAITVPSTPVAPVHVALPFAPPTFALQFVERGLPHGAAWSVQLNANATVNGTAGTPIVFTEENGSFTYVARTPQSVYQASVNGSGQVTIEGSGILVYVTFRLVTYAVYFEEGGLPSGTQWALTVGTNTTRTDAATLILNQTNGSYVYSVGGVHGYTPSPVSGNYTVHGSGVSETIVFSIVAFSVSFTEKGLTSGSTWSVTLNGLEQSGTGAITFPGITNGTYTYTVSAIAGYNATPNNGSVTVKGHAVSVAIGFGAVVVVPPSNSTSPATFLGLPAAEGYSVLGGIIIALLLVVLVVALWMRRGKARPESVSPPAPAEPGEPPATP